MPEEYVSDDGPGSDLFDPYETGQWKNTTPRTAVAQDQTCPKCNGEGYIVFRVYPWDGCSYDEKPCDLCNPRENAPEYGDEPMDESDDTSFEVIPLP